MSASNAPISVREFLRAHLGTLRSNYVWAAALYACITMPIRALVLRLTIATDPYWYQGFLSGEPSGSTARLSDITMWLGASLAAGAIVFRAVTPGATTGRSLVRSAARLGAVFACAFVVYALSILGLVLLVVPGLIVYSGCSAACTVAVIERAGPLVALQRSFELARGARLGVLSAFAIQWAAVTAVIGLLFALANLPSVSMRMGSLEAVGYVSWTLTSAWTLVVDPATILVGATLYRLRTAGDVDVERMRRLFE